MKKTKKQKKIIIAKIGRSYQLKGYFKIYSWADPIESVFEITPWFVQIKQNQLSQLKGSDFLDYSPLNEENLYQVKVSDHGVVGKNLIARLNGINSPEEARILTNCEIYIDRESLVELEQDNYYWCDLINLKVINLQNQELGSVSKLIETKANSLLEIKNLNQTKPILVPFLALFIKKVDLKKQQIIVDWHQDW